MINESGSLFSMTLRILTQRKSAGDCRTLLLVSNWRSMNFPQKYQDLAAKYQRRGMIPPKYETHWFPRFPLQKCRDLAAQNRQVDMVPRCYMVGSCVRFGRRCDRKALRRLWVCVAEPHGSRSRSELIGVKLLVYLNELAGNVLQYDQPGYLVLWRILVLHRWGRCNA